MIFDSACFHPLTRNPQLTMPICALCLRQKGPWPAREGLMVESFQGDMILTGGRGTGGIGFFNDVWRSSDGSSW